MPIKFTLANTIEAEGITKYRLSKDSGVRPNTVSNICNGDVRNLSVEVLDAILISLNRLTDKSYGLDAILVYEPLETP